MKYIVTMPVETEVAMVIDAVNEEQAEAEALRLAASGNGEFLNQFLDPREFVEFTVCPTVNEIRDAAALGYGDALAANRS